MTTALWVELVCGHCSRTGPGQYVTDARVPRKEIIDQAKGWSFVKDWAFCPLQSCKKTADEIKQREVF